MSSTALVIMPTYNEAELLESSVRALRQNLPNIDLLIVDDNSPDGTGQIADGLADGQTFSLHRDRKSGLGAAYLAGFDWAKKREYEFVVEMDADGSHQASDLVKLLEAIEQADLAIGSRWVTGGAVLNWPWYRKLISRAGNFYARLMLRSGVLDMTAGFRAYRMSALNSIDLTDISAHGYAFQIEMALRMLRANQRIVEVPITFIERTKGRSKMTAGIVLEAFWLVTKWGLYRSA